MLVHPFLKPNGKDQDVNWCKKHDVVKGPSIWIPGFLPGNTCILFPQFCGDGNLAFHHVPYEEFVDNNSSDKNVGAYLRNSGSCQ